MNDPPMPYVCLLLKKQYIIYFDVFYLKNFDIFGPNKNVLNLKGTRKLFIAHRFYLNWRIQQKNKSIWCRDIIRICDFFWTDFEESCPTYAICRHVSLIQSTFHKTNSSRLVKRGYEVALKRVSQFFLHNLEKFPFVKVDILESQLYST